MGLRLRGVIRDDRSLRAVEYGTHGVISLAGDGNEYLTDDAALDLHDCNVGIVVGQVGESLSGRDTANLFNVACNPPQQVDRMATAANNAVTKGIVSPVFLACMCLEHMIVVMCILGLNEGQFADLTLVNELLC